jgi:hypothetical protein
VLQTVHLALNSFFNCLSGSRRFYAYFSLNLRALSRLEGKQAEKNKMTRKNPTSIIFEE